MLNKLSLIAMLAVLGLSPVYASHNNNYVDEGNGSVLVDSGLASHAKDLGFLDKFKFSEEMLVDNLINGSIFMKNAGINGINSGLMVLDSAFEPDHSIQFSSQPDLPKKQLKDKEISHGTAVAAIAASTNEKLLAMASGATVYPINARPMFYMTREQIALIEPKKQQLEMLRAAFERDIEIPYIQKLKTLRIEAQKYQEASNQEELQRIEAEREQIIKDHQENYNHYGLVTGVIYREIKEISSMKRNLFDRLEETIEWCIANKQPIPHVVNMSLGCELSQSEANLVVSSLIRLFKKYDVLLVTSAGNDSNTDDLKYIGEKCEDNSSTCDIKKIFLDNPEIRERVMFVMASDLDQCAEFSTRAGMAKDHTLITFGYNFNTSTYAADGSVLKQGKTEGGTSIAAPRVAAVATVLKKYFPELTMVQIKSILLETAVKPKNSEEDFGRGSLNPAEAWKAAVKMTTPTAPVVATAPVERIGLFSKLKGLFVKKN